MGERAGAELLGLPGEQPVREALEGLAEHHKAADAVAAAQVQVAEQARAPPAAPFRREHHQVQRVRLLHLEPVAAAPAGGVGRVRVLGHQPLVASGEGLLQEGLGAVGVRVREPRDDEPGRQAVGERAMALAGRCVEERLAVERQTVEAEHRERQRRAQLGIVAVAAEAAHRHLKGQRAAVRRERQRLAVQHQLAGGQRRGGGDDLRHRGGYLVALAAVDAHRLALLVDLHAGAVELVLQDGLGHLREGVVQVRRRLRQHRHERAKELELERVEPGAALGAGDGCDLGDVAAQHVRAAHARDGDVEGHGEGVQHQRLQRALAQLAEQEPREPALLVRRCLCE